MEKVLAICIVLTFLLIFPVSQSLAGRDRESDDWQFALSPLFLWGMSLDGTTVIGPVSAPLQLDFKDDVFGNLGAVFTVHFDAKKNDLALFAEYQYVNLDPSSSIPNGPTVDVDFTIQAA
ncbi:MAG: hypothetical protein ACI8PB_005526 [Desulforhopalus sp.]|jgi:hypothetical protein